MHFPAEKYFSPDQNKFRDKKGKKNNDTQKKTGP